MRLLHLLPSLWGLTHTWSDVMTSTFLTRSACDHYLLDLQAKPAWLPGTGSY